MNDGKMNNVANDELLQEDKTYSFEQLVELRKVRAFERLASALEEIGGLLLDS